MLSGQLKNWEFDIGDLAYSGNGAALEVSLPNILRINYNPAIFMIITPSVVVNLFNPYASLRQINFGNSPGITVFYEGNQTLGAQNYQYVNMLTSLMNMPVEVGTTRIVAPSQRQATNPIYLLENVGVGKYGGETKFPLNYPDQFIPTITYLQDSYVLNGFTKLSYRHLTSSRDVFMYFYNNRGLDASRSIGDSDVIKNYAKPQTGFEQRVAMA